MVTKVTQVTKVVKVSSMLVQYNFLTYLIIFVMKLFVKILRVLEIAIPFLKMVVDQFRKDKEKEKQENPSKEV